MTEEMLNSVEFLTEFTPGNQELEKRFSILGRLLWRLLDTLIEHKGKLQVY